ncbi:hypothetical protein [Leptothrix discophora]|uniref:Uncharacterized protein n=1 Tax=Leptothrix discophora TaxID=89 RepID=A0ABT9G1K9_LEPDI|nr:hypothetical protein [Leptothrix discophora]MDP4300376.1 hypothetical protein [Leptothrix discophora]
MSHRKIKCRPITRHVSTWRATRERCDCGGYWFPHRITGGACHHGPRCDYYLALRAGATQEEAEAQLSADQLATLPERAATRRTAPDSSIPF